MVVAPVDSQGQVTVYNHSASVDLVASVQGFYQPFGPTNGVANKPMSPIAPVRVLDTRSGSGAPKRPIPARGTLKVKVAGVAGIPAGATGVMVNLTAVTPTAWGDASSKPAASALNFMRGQITPVLMYLPIAHGYVNLYNPYGSVNVVADVEAYTTA